ncbi:MAG: LysR family transcriptional regulator [Clostridia bacterium]|nr:LysR family transcriptional regulator [Clostridia bacterium]
MEIRNLITFVQVAELMSFTKAAKVLGYSQSTVSFQIKQLENEMNCLLFERINHNITLTDKGRELLEYAVRIRSLTDELAENWGGETAPHGLIRIVSSDSVCEDFIKSHYEDFHNKYPDISLNFQTADTKAMFGMLDRNEADLMMTLDDHVYDSDYVIAKEVQVKMNIVTGMNSPYVRSGKTRLTELKDLPFILTEQSMGYRHSFDEAMAKHSIEVTPIVEIGRTDLITNMLEKGIGVAYLPEFVTERKVREGKLRYIEVEDMKSDIWKQLIYHKNKWLSRSMRAVIDYIAENTFGTL